MKELKKKINRSSPSVGIVFRSGGGSWRDPCLFLSRQFRHGWSKGFMTSQDRGVTFPQIWLSTCKMLSIGNLKGFTGLKTGSDKKVARTKVQLRQQTLNPAIPQCQSKYFNSTSWAGLISAILSLSPPPPLPPASSFVCFQAESLGWGRNSAARPATPGHKTVPPDSPLSLLPPGPGAVLSAHSDLRQRLLYINKPQDQCVKTSFHSDGRADKISPSSGLQ